MSYSTILLLVGTGLLAGFLAGLIGIGGSLIMIPAMVFLLGMSQHSAQGTSLAVMLPPIGILAAFNYYREGHVNLKFAIILAITFIAGSYFGSKLAVAVPQQILKKLFGVLLLLMAFRLLLSK